MSNPCRPHLPLEILDYIVDLLHDEPETLGQCCLVSKSWVARTRKYLFASIMFRYPGDLGLWKKTFSDPENSPAYHTRALFVLCPQVFTAADAEEGAWIRMFPHVVRLVWGTIENLYESEKPSILQVFNLICSLPLLEDLRVVDCGGDNNDHDWAVFQTSTSPALTGTLELYMPLGMEHITRRLLGLPNGLHFQKLVCSWCFKENIQPTMDLVVGCSDTLEFVDIDCWLRANSWTASIDFSGVTRLKEIVFRPRRTDPMWIVMALQTIASEHRDLREILIQVPDRTRSISDPFNVREILGEVCYRQRMDLDRLLVQFWESRAIRPKIAYCVAEEKKTAMCAYTGNLLPEITERGIIELVDLDELHGSRKIRF